MAGMISTKRERGAIAPGGGDSPAVFGAVRNNSGDNSGN
jgi:hypothetical protein